jgi:DNA-binding HxlR family transcriptional regulator
MPCTVNHTIGIIGGRFMPIAIYNLLSSTKRYSELKRLIPAITGKMLIQHLKELEVHRPILRKALPVVPPVIK